MFIINGVYFICCKMNYIEVVNEQMTLLLKSGLYDETKKLIIFITMCRDNEIINLLKNYDKDNKFVYIATYKNLFEKFAINNYKKYINDDNYYLYYFHTKAITKGNTIFERIRQILNHYIITKYKLCIILLENYDAVGCSLYLYPKLHFSGNFWWSKSTHLNELKDVGTNYLDPEMYICSLNKKYISLSQNTNNGIIEEHINRTDLMILSNLTNIPENNIYHKKLLQLCSK